MFSHFLNVYLCRDQKLQLFRFGKQLLDLSWVGQELETHRQDWILFLDQPAPARPIWPDPGVCPPVRRTKLSPLLTSSSYCCSGPTVRIWFYNYFEHWRNRIFWTFDPDDPHKINSVLCRTLRTLNLQSECKWRDLKTTRCLKKKDKKAHFSHDFIGLIKERATIEVGKQQMSLQVKTS